MITRVAIEPEALVALGAGLPTPMAKASHEYFLRTLRAHGTIVFSSNAEADAFVRAIQNEDFPVWARQKWKQLLTEFLKMQPKRAAVFRPAAPITLAEVEGAERLVSLWSPHADLAVLNDIKTAALGVPEEDGHCWMANSDLEVSTAGATPLCEHFVRIQDLVQSGVVPAGQSREHFAREVLDPLARESTAVVAVDKYLFHTLWRSGGRRRNAEHVSWLLERLDAQLRPRSSVTLIGGADGYGSAEATVRLLERLCQGRPPRNIGTLTVTLLPMTPSLLPHDRHLRFNIGAAIVIDAGFDRLADPQIRDQDGMKWQYKWDTSALDLLRAAEQRCVTSRLADSATASWS